MRTSGSAGRSNVGNGNCRNGFVMAPIGQLTIGPAPLPRPEKRAKQAKVAAVDVRKAENSHLYVLLGGCMEEVRNVFGMGLEEFTYAIGKNDPRQVARQLKGEERPQIEAVFAVDRFRAALVIALAKSSAGVEVVTEIRVKRSA